MSKNIVSLLIVAVIIFAGIAGIFLLSNQKTQNANNINLTPTINSTETYQPQTPTTAIINQQKPTGSSPATMANTITTADGLQMQDIIVGVGAEVKSGDTVTVNYLGTLQNGTKFDSSYDRNQPFTAQIGVGHVIKGWDEGVVGMQIGGKRRLTIPPALAYGSQGISGAIPPNSTLIFEVELIGIK